MGARNAALAAEMGAGVTALVKLDGLNSHQIATDADSIEAAETIASELGNLQFAKA